MTKQEQTAWAKHIYTTHRPEWAVTLRPKTPYANPHGLEALAKNFLKRADRLFYRSGGTDTLRAFAVTEDGDHVHFGISRFPYKLSNDQVRAKLIKAANDTKEVWDERHIADHKRFMPTPRYDDAEHWTDYVCKKLPDSDAIIHTGDVRDNHPTTFTKFFKDSPLR